MLNRRVFLFGAIPAALAMPLAARAQQAAKSWRIGYLAYVPCHRILDPNYPFLQGLRALGYLEGRNLFIECRDAIGRFDRLPALAAELVGLDVDVLVTEGTPQSVVGKRATAKVPIVMVGVGDPVGNGLVASLARPGGNITGSAMFPIVDVVVKGLEILKEIVPSVSRIAVVWDPENLALVSVDKQLDEASRPLKLTVRRISVREPDDVQAALGTVLDQRAQALLVHPLPVGPAGVERIFEFALRTGLPAITWFESFAPMDGALFSYGPRLADVYHRAGGLIDKILKGANPGNLPVEQPRTFGLIINLRTARALGVTIPPALLLRADQVVE